MTRAALVAVVASALLVPGLARAELVPGSQGAQDALLAVAPDGSPRVAFVAVDGSLQVATRAADGTWAAQALAGLLGPRALIVGFKVAANGGADLLAEDPKGSWLALAEQQGVSWRVRTVATAPRGGLLGFGGLALDSSGRPLVAYTYELGSQRSWLRLVHEDAAGRLVGERVTRDGFPSSEALPSAAPVVLPNGAVRVLETYDFATIEWARTKDHKDWVGQFIYGTQIGGPAGIVQAAAVTGAVWSAWTELFPSFGESQLLLTVHGHGETTTILSHHAFLVALALSPTGPEVAGDDYVDLAGARTAYAGIVSDVAGATTELDGDLYGYALDPLGGRQYLLLDENGLGWYRAATPPVAKVDLSAAVDGAAFALTGRVEGVVSGSVEVWRETEAGPQLLTTLPLAPDGSFSLTDTPPVRPLTYRVVYRDPVSGLPIASLFRTVLGS
ncbi:MAG TPA: hypothetical protein VII51_02065 [Gaiellaceae bacterium]